MLSAVVLGLAGCGQDMPIDLAERGGWVRLPAPPLSGRNEANIVGGDKFGPDGSALLADAYIWTP